MGRRGGGGGRRVLVSGRRGVLVCRDRLQVCAITAVGGEKEKEKS